MKKQNKKSQITFFVLIGFIIIVLMGFVFYVNKQTSSYKTKKETLEAHETTFDITVIKDYIESCLEKTTRDGINLLGAQGGVIYPNQGGANETLPLIQGEYFLILNKNGIETNITYGLKTINVPSFSCEDATPSTLLTCKNEETATHNLYPWEDFPIAPFLQDCTDAGCFGRNTLSPLTGASSMYDQIKIYIENKIEECTDFSIFTPQGFNISKNGTIGVEVKTNDKTVVSTLIYPLSITDPTSKKQTKIEEFYYDTNIRLKTLHTVAEEITILDKNYQDFEIDNSIHYHAQTSADNKIAIEVLTFNPVNNLIFPSQDNVVRITDNSNTRPFIFQFARQNRPPALEEMSSSQTISVGETLDNAKFTIISYDPDESTTTTYFTSTQLGITKTTTLNYPIIAATPSSFEVEVCVSDNQDPVKQCTTSDDSKDWQIITFNII
jgi:hypothetical protein